MNQAFTSAHGLVGSRIAVDIKVVDRATPPLEVAAVQLGELARGGWIDQGASSAEVGWFRRQRAYRYARPPGHWDALERKTIP